MPFSLRAMTVSMLGAVLILTVGCPAGSPVDPAKASTKPKVTAKPSDKKVVRGVQFVGTTKKGKVAPQPDVIEIKVNGKAIALERTGPNDAPALPATVSGPVEISLKNSKFVTLSVNDEQKGDLSVVLLPWKDNTFIGEVLTPDFKDFAARLKKRAVHYPLGWTDVTDDNVKGVYVGRYRVPRHTYFIDKGDLFMDPSSEYYVRITGKKLLGTVPLLRLAYEKDGKILGFSITVSKYPVVLPAPPASPPPPPVPAPVVPDTAANADPATLSTPIPLTAATIDEFETKEVNIDDAPFPDPGE